MTRRRAWIVAAITTVSLVALIVGIGATFGQFGFRGGDTPADAASAPAQPPSISGVTDDGQWEGDEHDDDDDDGHEEHEREHESTDHEREAHGDDEDD